MEMPLTELWNDSGPVAGEPVRYLGVADIRALLRQGTEGVVATKRLQWLRGIELFEWWKAEARPRLVPPEADSSPSRGSMPHPTELCGGRALPPPPRHRALAP